LRRYVSSKPRLTCSRLHGVISWKTELFIITGVRTTNPKMEELSVETVARDWNCKIFRGSFHLVFC
jgi:hypothetical protein